MFPVPESAVSVIRDGAPVQISISGLNRTVQGKVTRFSRQLNPQTRTMETEVDVPNDDLSITPGMYGWAELTLEEHKDVLSVPVQALSVGEQTRPCTSSTATAKSRSGRSSSAWKRPTERRSSAAWKRANSSTSATAARSGSVRPVQAKILPSSQTG